MTFVYLNVIIVFKFIIYEVTVLRIVFNQVFVLFLFVAIGFILGRTKIVKAENSSMLSNLLVYVFLPCCNVKAFANNFTVQYISQNYNYILFGMILLIIFVFITKLCAKPLSRNKYDRYVYEYSMLVPNYGYMGYALAISCFGEMGLLNFIMFSTPFTIYIYAMAFPFLTKHGFTLKGFLNASMISVIIGIIIGLSGIKLGGVVETVVVNGGNCMAPISMILTGLVISEFNIKEIVKKWQIYPVTLMRLVILPLITGAVLTMLPIDKSLVGIAILFMALPCGLNTVIFPKIVGEDCSIGAGLAVFSTVGACLTIPVVFAIFGLM